MTVYPYPGGRVVTTQTRAAGATTWVTGASTRLTMHRDTLKSVSAESFASGTNSNTLARRTFYAPYGEKLASATWNGAPPNSKGWIGERAEPDAGLIYLNARWYDPSLSRFTRPDKLDPIIPGVGPDQYGYAGGDPVNNSDPGGEIGAFGAGVGGGLGAAAGLAGRAIGDLWEGKLSSFEDYAKATAEGALVGAAVGSGGAVLGAAVGGAIAVGGALVEGRVPTPGEVIAGAAGGALAGFGSPVGGKAVAAAAKGAVAGAALKGEVAQVAKGEVKQASLAERILAADRTGSGLKADASHRAASFLTKEQLEAGTSFTIIGGDGVTRELLQTSVEMNGKHGIFEYILDPTKGITHQRFISGGTITGSPNQRVP